MLGGSSSWDLPRLAREDVGRAEVPAPSADRLDLAVETSRVPLPEAAGPGPAVGGEPPYSWPSLLLRSYASAVTLALAWVLWTGRSANGPEPGNARESSPPRRRVAETASTPSSAPGLPDLPASRTTALGKTLVVDDLELTPLMVLHKSVRLTRDLGEDRLVRDYDHCLVLTVRVKNLSEGRAIRPLEAGDLVNGEAFAIESMPPGARLGLFTLGPESEWSIDEQEFPKIAPGESGDLRLISEPVAASRLAGALNWRLRLRTSASRPDGTDLAVRLNRTEIHGDGD